MASNLAGTTTDPAQSSDRSPSTSYGAGAYKHGTVSPSGSRSPPGSASGEPPRKKRRRRRSAVTGTLYYPGEEPDPDAGLDPSTLASDDERKKSKAPEKRFPCDWLGCDKIFSRPDHLSRHRLNHEPEKIYTCNRCSKVFVRADLLTRHAERHDRREAAQAAGTSLSAANPHLAAATTTVINTSRPSASLSNLVLPNSDSSMSPVLGSAGFGSSGPSPSFSAGSPLSGGQGFHGSLGGVPTSTADLSSIPSPRIDFGPPGLNFATINALGNNQLGNTTGPGSIGNLSGFMSGTAMSLDAPFFSGQDYQWLFDGSMGEGWQESMSWSRLGSPVSQNGINSNSSFQTHSTQLLPPMQGNVPVDPTLQQIHYGRTQAYGASPHSSGSGSAAATPGDGIPRPHDAASSTKPIEISTTSSPAARPPDRTVTKPYKDESTAVSEETRQKILATVKEMPGLGSDPRFSAQALNHYLHLYWANVHDSSFPILHRPTFKTKDAFVPLLCCMISLGGYFTDPEGHELATALHEDIRKQIISSQEFRPRASLDMIQTTLLMILYGKLCSTRYHHEMAHIFWGSTLTMYRRSALFAPRGAHPPHELRNDLNAQWRAWIEDETAKRAAYTAFLIDVQHAAIFRHAPTLSAFQIQHALPADEEEWTASTAQEWHKLHSQSRPGAPFMSALKASLMPGLAPPFLNPFSRVVILHGLISVAFDMQWRDVFMLGLAAPDGPVKDWRETISAAFNAWKSRLDSCLISSSAPAHQLLRASISLYALAHIVLSIDVHELQIYAGAQKALGLVVAQHVIESTRERVSKWATSKDGRASTWHAAHFLRSSLLHLNQSNDLLHCLHYTWACYISVLTVFAYGRALSGPPPPYEASSTVRSVEAAMGYLDAMCTQSPDSLLTVQTKHHSLPLIAAIYDVIKYSRWEIALEGARILQRLLRSISV